MSPGSLREDLARTEELTPEIESVLDGSDAIVLDADLVAPDGEAADDAGRRAVREAEAVLAALEEPGAAAGDAANDGSAEAASGSGRESSLWVRIMALPVASRIKLAFSGNRASRQILCRDPLRLVQRCILANPRLTQEEVLAFAKNRSQHGEILRHIGSQRDWVRHYPIRVALVLNPKTPLPVSLRLLGGIVERDMRAIARSRNVPTAVQAQARRVILRRGPGGG